MDRCFRSMLGTHEPNKDDMGCSLRFRKKKKIELEFSSRVFQMGCSSILEWVREKVGWNVCESLLPFSLQRMLMILLKLYGLMMINNAIFDHLSWAFKGENKEHLHMWYLNLACILSLYGLNILFAILQMEHGGFHLSKIKS